MALVASTGRNGSAWPRALSFKQEHPRLLVADKHEGLLAGAYQAWSTTVWRCCHWHLHQSLARQLAAYGIHPSSTHDLVTLAGDAFRGPEHWEAFVQAMTRHDWVNLVARAASASCDLADEFCASTLSKHYSNGAAEKVLNVIKGTIARQGFC